MRHLARALSLLFGLVLLGGSAAAQDPGTDITPGGKAAPREFLIGPEDVLAISVWQNAELTQSIPVRPDGHISLPLLKDIPAAGRTPAELALDIEARLKAYMTTAVVSVIVAEVNSYRVSVLGKVLQPGRYNFRAPTTVLEALAEAGGLQEYAKEGDIVVLRRPPIPREDQRAGPDYLHLAFDYSDAIKANGPAGANFRLMAGDIIVVP
jgi:polysaccharide export outer membrane protein